MLQGASPRGKVNTLSQDFMTDEGIQGTGSPAADKRFSLEELQVNFHTKMGKEVPVTGHTMSTVPTSAQHRKF